MNKATVTKIPPAPLKDKGGLRFTEIRKIPPAPLKNKGELRFTEIREATIRPDRTVQSAPEVMTREQRRVRRGILNSLGKSGRGNHTLASYAAYTDFYKLEKEEDHDNEAV